ncbi:MAG TPA: BatA domain-containing protein [Thermoanaerobaculia bacterium]|nr:BatA domain-containing protein [Thermoanaerobaculia bacterium]
MLTSLAALFGLISIPLLAVIYLFHRRPQTRQVSSLILWAALRRPATAGRKREFLRLPLTFWLEALALLLLVLAAAGPMLPRLTGTRPLIVILDDSLSMQAGAQQRAREYVSQLGSHFDPIRYILAGATPQVASLQQWSCNAPSSDIDAALAFATQLAGPNALVLVVTDHAPPHSAGPRVQWHAFGEPAKNAAFIAAARSRAGRDRVLLEIAGEPASMTIAADGRTLFTGRRTGRFSFELPPGAKVVEAQLSDDDAAFDNHVTLLPERKPPVLVTVDVKDALLRRDVERAVTATGRALLTGVGVGVGQALSLSRQPERLPYTITDHPTTANWSLELITAPTGIAHAGPFLIDRTNPISEGVDLDGVIWTASSGTMAGTPVVLAGDQPLLTEESHHFRMRLNPSQSTLQRSPAWPSLIWNLIELRGDEAPGFRAANVVDGGLNELVLPDGRHKVMLASHPGIWRVDGYQFACNALNAEESDLSKAKSGTWNGWSEAALIAGGYENVAWLLLLAALAVLAIHQRITSQYGGHAVAFGPDRARHGRAGKSGGMAAALR